VFPVVKQYSNDTQLHVREELKAQGCLPEGDKYPSCKIPYTYAWIIDYYKMREQTRIAVREHWNTYSPK